MRSLTTLLFILFTFALTTLSAQGAWVPAPVPQGEYVPNQVIIRYPANDPDYVANPGKIKSDIQALHGLVTTVTQIDQAGLHFLITFHKTIQSENLIDDYCVREVKHPLPCSLCQVVSNPGGGGPMGRGDGLWLNFRGSSGLANSGSVWEEYSALELFGQDGFDPLVGAPNVSSSIQNTTSNSSCYEGQELPFAPGIHPNQLQIAILDSGISPDNYMTFFSYFTEEGQQLPILRHLTVDESVLPPMFPSGPYDGNGHGTAVAFLIAHDFVNKGIKEKIKLHSYRVLDNGGVGSLASVLWGLDQAIINDVDIINLSFGFREGNCEGESLEGTESVFNSFFERAQDGNILIFTSAGNDGENLTSQPQWPAAVSGFDNLFTIGADGCQPGVRWEMSNFGNSHVELTAPGVDIALPYIMTANPGYYILDSGTSFATPLTVGAAASHYVNGGFQAAVCALTNDDPNSENNDPSDSQFGSVIDIDISRCPIITPEESDPNFPGGNIGGFRGSVNAFPNPFDNQLSIVTDVAYDQKIIARILDGNGRVLLQQSSVQDKLALNTSSLSAGVYFLQIISGSESHIKRIIKH